ncbi:MAG: hypothetical protein NZZ41_02985 [Candidatus Dojkabacteria bacterium]|nr:hypothetical protein [Candidatus Dojkabacteria bacterium]
MNFDSIYEEDLSLINNNFKNNNLLLNKIKLNMIKDGNLYKKVYLKYNLINDFNVCNEKSYITLTYMPETSYMSLVRRFSETKITHFNDQKKELKEILYILFFNEKKHLIVEEKFIKNLIIFEKYIYIELSNDECSATILYPIIVDKKYSDLNNINIIFAIII